MSDGDRLERRIARLGEEIRLTGTGRRVLSAANPDALLALLLQEVAETVLPRCLSVEAEDGGSARIEASGGRVLALETAAGTVSGRGGQFGDVDAFARALGQALRGFVGSGTRLTVASLRLTRRPGPDDLRCPPDRIPTGAAGTGGGLPALATALAERARAWTLLGADGAPVAGAGEAADLDRLARFAAAAAPVAAAEMDALPGGPAAPACLVCGSADGDGSSLVYARAGDAFLLMQLDNAAAAGLGRLWQQIVGD